MRVDSLLRRSCLRATGLAGLLALAAMIAFAPAVHAQLPRVQLPNVPGVGLPGTITDTVDRAQNTVGNAAGQVDRLADARRLRVDALLRTQRATVERDPAG